MSIESRLYREEPDFEKAFFDFENRLDEHAKSTVKYKKLIEEVEESGDFELGLKKMKEFYAQRKSVLEKTNTRPKEGFEINTENLQADIDNIIIAHNDPERMLGNGAVAEVVHLRGIYNSQSKCCVKIVCDENKYLEGNTLEKECQFLEMLEKIEVEGVRTPRPFYYFSNLRIKGLVMEELDAFNFRRVIEEQTTSGIKDELPPNFDLEDFFKRLKEYLKEMHKIGIYHGDIALRNIMIHRQTGLPLLIDFGKAKHYAEMDKTNINMPDFAQSDLASLDSAKAEAKLWLEVKKADNLDKK